METTGNGTTMGPVSNSGTSVSAGSTSSDDVADSSGGPACDPGDQALIDICIEMANAMDTCPEVGECNCNSCACELAACNESADCTAIRECAQMTGCNGIDCLDPTTCGDVINMAGGPTGEGTSLALTLSNCNMAAGCPITCGGTGTDSGGSDSGGSDSGSTDTGGSDSGGSSTTAGG